MRTFLAALLLLWLQLFRTLVPTWIDGSYYEYGWFVPVLAAGFAWRRWQMIGGTARILPTAGPPRVPAWVVFPSALALGALAPLRIIVVADPGWRPPLLIHVAIVVGLSHFLLWKLLGRRVSLGLLPVTVFALSAVPYPWQFEQALIGRLSRMVLGFTHEIFLLAGRPVELTGGRLAMGSEVVEVTEGCSGIRSLQSLVMVALFFGELLLLPALKRVMLIAVAGACALGVNTLRAFWLAEIHFSRGKEAAAGAHDRIGQLAFLLSATILFLAAVCLLRTKPAGRLVITQSPAVLP